MPQRIESMPKKLQREYDKLVELGSKLQMLIAEADGLAKDADRTAFYEAQSRRYSAEADLLTRDAIYSLALIECVAARRAEIEKRIIAFVEHVRGEAELPPNSDIPLALLQGQTAWWALKSELNRCPRLDWLRVDRIQSAATVARGQAEHFQTAAVNARKSAAAKAKAAKPEPSAWRRQLEDQQRQRAAVREQAAGLLR